MAYRLPSGSNTFSISFDSTGMIVSATRDPSQFALARYVQYVETKTKVFRYLKLDLDEPGRITSQNDYFWAPGQDAPTGPDNVGAFSFFDSSTVKYAFAWTLPDEAIDQAEWGLKESQMGIIQQKAMTSRTMLVATLAQTASNWPSTNTSTVNSLNAGAGKFDTASSDPASANYLAIRKALVAAATEIVKQTNAVIKWRDVNMVGSPLLFNKMGNSAEMVDYLKGSPDAKSKQDGQFMEEYNMPPKYAGIEMICEDSVKVTSKPNITTGLATGGTRAWVWADQSPVLLSRKGSIDGKYGGKPPATVQLYTYRNMEVWTKSDTDNERQMGRVVDDVKAVLPYGQSGYLMQSAL